MLGAFSSVQLFLLNFLEGGGPMKGFINGLFSNLCSNTCITYKILEKGLKHIKRAPILLLNGAQSTINLDWEYLT